MLPPELACARDPLPTTAAMGVTTATVTGRAVVTAMGSPLANVTVTAFPDGASGPSAMATTDADGRFNLMVPLMDGMPFSGKLTLSATGYHETDYVFPFPLDGGNSLRTMDGVDASDLVVTNDEDWVTSGTTLGQTSVLGFGVVRMLDCAGSPVTGRTVSTEGSLSLRVLYVSPDATTPVTEPSSTTTTAYIVNGPTDRATVVSVDYGAFRRDVTVQMRAGVVTMIDVTPHGAMTGP